MRRTLLLIFVVVISAVAATRPASAAGGLYRTDAQAERFATRGLKKWAGIDLTRVRSKTAFCINGYYSRYEQAHPQRFDQDRVNRSGEHLFRSFACTLTAGSRTFELYLRTRALEDRNCGIDISRVTQPDPDPHAGSLELRLN
jgi:hypothetical protein